MIREAFRRSWLHKPYVAAKMRRSSSAREVVFSGFYDDNIWADAESRSGGGSSLAATADVRAHLPGLLRDLHVQSLLDIPCGDFYWMRNVDLAGIDYVGADIVSALVDDLNAQYAGPGRSFRRLDIVDGPLPCCDAVMVRDLFIHLPFEMIDRALANVSRSGATWLITNDYPEIVENRDVSMGDHRFLNLQLSPFRMSVPRWTIADSSSDRSDKRLVAWKVSDLPTSLSG